MRMRSIMGVWMVVTVNRVGDYGIIHVGDKINHDRECSHAAEEGVD